MPRLFILLPLIAVLVIVPGRASSKTLGLEECQRLKERIDYYTELRRAGGGASQMEVWEQGRETAENTFRTYRCSKYGRKLRKSGPSQLDELRFSCEKEKSSLAGNKNTHSCDRLGELLPDGDLPQTLKIDAATYRWSGTMEKYCFFNEKGELTVCP